MNHKLIALNRALQKHFSSADYTLKEVPFGRTNTNFYLVFRGKKYFLRTNILKVPEEKQFGGKLEKEYKILSLLEKYQISAKPYTFHEDGDISFLLLEHIDGSSPRTLEGYQAQIVETLKKLQNIDIGDFDFLERFTLRSDFEEKIRGRIKQIHDTEILGILGKIMEIIDRIGGDIEDEFCLCHNDFRSDNLLLRDGDQSIGMIDVEGFIIADRYIDIAEYYVGGIFWDNFSDTKNFIYEDYLRFLNRYCYTDTRKQLYVFLLQYCSYLSWIAAHVSSNPTTLTIYTDTLESNRKKYYQNVEKFIDSLV